MNKHLKGLRAVALSALLIFVGASVLSAQGFPTQVILNSQVGNTASGNVFGVAATSASNTALSLCPQPAVCGWVNRIIFDTVAGASGTAKVIFYDATSTAMCTSSAVIATFTLTTYTASTGTLGNMVMGGSSNQVLDILAHNGLWVATVTDNPNTVTASVVLGRPINAGSAVLTR